MPEGLGYGPKVQKAMAFLQSNGYQPTPENVSRVLETFNVTNPGVNPLQQLQTGGGEARDSFRIEDLGLEREESDDISTRSTPSASPNGQVEQSNEVTPYPQRLANTTVASRAQPASSSTRTPTQSTPNSASTSGLPSIDDIVGSSANSEDSGMGFVPLIPGAAPRGANSSGPGRGVSIPLGPTPQGGPPATQGPRGIRPTSQGAMQGRDFIDAESRDVTGMDLESPRTQLPATQSRLPATQSLLEAPAPGLPAPTSTPNSSYLPPGTDIDSIISGEEARRLTIQTPEGPTPVIQGNYNGQTTFIDQYGRLYSTDGQLVGTLPRAEWEALMDSSPKFAQFLLSVLRR